MIIKEYKNGKKTICYISSIRAGQRDLFFVCTGSPKDKQCLSWKYETMADAERTAQEYFENTINFFKGV